MDNWIIKAAIKRSISHNEIVTIKIPAKDMAEAYSEIYAAYDGADVEYTSTGENGVYDVWGWTREQEGTLETDFRLNVIIVSRVQES